jgi:hypothetical protein
LDRKALSGAERLGLPTEPGRLLEPAGDTEPAVLAAAPVRAALDRNVAEDVAGGLVEDRAENRAVDRLHRAT